MAIKDSLGNRLEVGNLVYWALSDWNKQRGIVAELIAVEDGAGVSDPRGAPATLPHLGLRIIIPVEINPRGDTHLNEFMRVVDPKQQAMLDKLMGGKPS